MLKILRVYGNMAGNQAVIVHAKVQFDDGEPFCLEAEGGGKLDLPRDPNDEECVPLAAAAFMWTVQAPTAMKLPVDVRALSRQ